jgi:transcriptional regulator GlxA family with amidase domain
MEILCNVKHENAHQISGSPETTEVRQIGIALFDGFALPDVASVIEIFQAANAVEDSTILRSSRYEVSLLSASGGRIASSSSVFVWTERVESRRRDHHFHALFIAGGNGATTALRDARLLAWIRLAYQNSRIVHPIAEGRLLLEASGFIDANVMHPDEDNRADGALPTNPFFDWPRTLRRALDIVDGDLGSAVAQRVADHVVPQGETQFDPILRAKTAPHISDQIRSSAQWMEANSGRPISIEDVAQVAAMSERNFLRRFKSEMGVAPSEYLLYVRLDMSCRLLVTTSLPVDKIARRSGIGSGGRLAKLFRKHLCTTPTDYRNRSKGSTS